MSADRELLLALEEITGLVEKHCDCVVYPFALPVAKARALLSRSAVPGWISVGERLPEFEIQVLGYSTARNLVSTCYRYKSDDRGWASAVLYSDEITHWMPLPEAP